MFLGHLLLLYYHCLYDVTFNTLYDMRLSHHNKDYGLYLTAYAELMLCCVVCLNRDKNITNERFVLDLLDNTNNNF